MTAVARTDTNAVTALARPPTPVSSRYFEPELETMARPELARLQHAHLLEQVPYVYEHSALVRSVWDEAGVHPYATSGRLRTSRRTRRSSTRTLSAPFCDEHRDPFGGLLCAPPSTLQVLGSTSGTTGDPTPLPQEPIGPMVRGLSRDFWEAGARPGDRVAFMMFTFRSGIAVERFEQIGLVPILLDPLTSEVPVLLEAAARSGPRSCTSSTIR